MSAAHVQSTEDEPASNGSGDGKDHGVDLAAVDSAPTPAVVSHEKVNEDDEEEEEDREPNLKYTRLTSSVASLYRNGDSTSAFTVTGDKMVCISILLVEHHTNT